MRLLRVVIALAVLACLLPFQPVQAQPAPPPETAMVDANDSLRLDWLTSHGARKLADYGAFSLWQLPAANALARAAARPTFTPGSGTIRLRGVDLNPAAESSLQTQALPSGTGLSILQFAGPVLPEWLATLRAAGIEPVAYLPDHAFIVWGSASAAASAFAGAGWEGTLRWQGAYAPLYRLAPELRGALSGPQSVTVQIVARPGWQAAAAQASALAESPLSAAEPVLNLINLRLRVDAARLPALAALPLVFNVEPYIPPAMQDEAQAQILAGNLTVDTLGRTVPTGPGYLAWLASKGFPTDPAAYPILDIVDDGLDRGDSANLAHPDFHDAGASANPDRVAYILNCTLDAKGDSLAGHGNLNAGIAAGYNDQAGFPYQDALGYSYGLGISPYGRLGATKVFRNSGPYDDSVCGGGYTAFVQALYSAGARITSNSWGAPASGVYNADAQEYDALTRDASTLPGNQEILHLFAAGNAGPGQTTLISPGTAKNVLTVGATENVREQGVQDGCGKTDADNANDIAGYSSRGPAADGRAKPDLVAPGTHIQGPATADPAFTGSQVCGGLISGARSKFYPAGQTLYTWSTGTSHATPAVAGAAQLAYEYYGRVIAPGQVPSPAMLKALLLNSPRYLDGVSANDTLPGRAQGWGMLNLGALFDGLPRQVHDQDHLFSVSGEQINYAYAPAQAGQPVRITLAWTDAPGTTSSGAALVNDLDLSVLTPDGSVYYGNTFYRDSSVPGGSPDRLNNVEQVLLPGGINGKFLVRVTAHNIAGDGVPGNQTALDQDFALTVSNAVQAPGPLFTYSTLQWSEVVGNQNGWIDPGETAGLSVVWTNNGETAASVSGALQVIAGQGIVLTPTAAYPDFAPGDSHANPELYLVKVGYNAACGAQITLEQTLNFTGGSTVLSLPPLTVGKPPLTVQYGGAPVLIPDKTPAGVAVPLTVTDPALPSSITAGVDISHTSDSDLVLKLLGPDGLSQVELARQVGGYQANFRGTLFDDAAPVAIENGAAPFIGRFRPQTGPGNTLSKFAGQNPAGLWELIAADLVQFDTGQVNAFWVTLNYQICSPVAPPYATWLPFITH